MRKSSYNRKEVLELSMSVLTMPSRGKAIPASLPALPALTYEQSLRARVRYPVPVWAACRADCGCLVKTENDLYEDPRDPTVSICQRHGAILACWECLAPNGLTLTKETDVVYPQPRVCQHCRERQSREGWDMDEGGKTGTPPIPQEGKQD